jgi:hypothetical protein
MIRRSSGQFRTILTSNVSLQDSKQAPGWTTGGTLIDGINLQPLPSERWTILAYSVRGQLTMTYFPLGFVTNYVPFGKFGKIKTSLVMDTDFTGPTGSVNNPQVVPALPLPQDSSLVADLWDPALNELPPAQNSAVQGTVGEPLSVSVLLPTPRPIQQGSRFGIGLWMLPSLLTSIPNNANFPCLMFWGAGYSIIYEDGHSS